MTMRNLTANVLLASALVFPSLPSVYGELLVGWDLVGYASAPIPPDAPSVTNAAGMNNSTITRGSGLIATGGTNSFVASSWTIPVSSTITDAIASNDYFTFTASSTMGNTFSVTNFSWRANRSGTGPSNFVLRSSADGFASDLAAWIHTSDIARSHSAPLNLVGQSNVEFRLYGFVASSAAGTARMTDGGSFGAPGIDVALFDEVSGGPPPPPSTNVQFTGSSGSIGEAGGAFTVTVFKTLASGDVSGSVSLGGTATQGTDYTINTTNFTMNGAVTSATFVITITDDAAIESTETVILTIATVDGGTIAAPSVFTLSITDNDVLGPAPSLNVWINEFHYDNTGADVDEGVEVAGPAGLDLAGYSLWLYDGACVCHYETTNLTGVIPNQSNGFGTVWFPIVGIQNGPDAIALVYGTTQVIQFISYEGVFTATNGPASGMTSVDVGVFQPTTGPVGHSLQLCGSGTNYAAFAWSTNLPHTRGLINDCQTIPGGSGYSPAQQSYIIAWWGSLGAYTGDGADDDGDFFSNLEEFIAGTIPVPPTGSNSFFRGIAITNGATRFVVTPSVTGRQYRLWSATNLLATQVWSQVAGPISGTGANVSLTDGIETNYRMFRLTVELENP